MQLSQIPTLVPLPWANSGTKNTIPTASQIAVTPGAASLTDGFPPLTFTPLNAGGIPPFGADWNGILNLLSANTRWDNAGGFYPYDATFSTLIGGYPKGAILSRVDATGFWLSTADNNAVNPETDTTGAWVPVNNDGITSVALTNANVTLSATQYAKNIITLTGALTANVQVIFPTIAGLRWKVVNNTTGSFTITCKTSAGTGFTIAQTGIQESFCDGVNLIPNIGNSSQVLRSAPAVGSSDALVLSQSYNPAVATDMTVSRAIGTSYINNTGRPIWVCAQINSTASTGNAYLKIGSLVISEMPTPSPILVSVFGLIPPGATYSVTIDSTGTLASWVEVR